MDTHTNTDFIVIGAGIAGASLAYHLAPHGRCVVLERESQPGYHTTGRSAAQYIATYGTPQVRALTLASRAFFEQPPSGFTDVPLITPRSVMTVGLRGQDALLDEAWAVLQSVGAQGERLSAVDAAQRVPVLRAEALCGAVWEAESFDMDVHALHHGFLRGMRHSGGELITGADVTAIARRSGQWSVTAGSRTWVAPVVINAAGAWGDHIAALADVRPLGLVPKRRTAVTLAVSPQLDSAQWPLTVAADESVYFKPEAGQRLLASPANADPTHAQDVQPEDLDVAILMDRLDQLTTLQARPERRWAGLRSFVADGDLVGGFDPHAPGFFWCVAQGGYGIQTSPAMGLACATLARDAVWPQALQAWGLSAAQLSPCRLSLAT
jgi:D-arginine dehydrogenase